MEKKGEHPYLGIIINYDRDKKLDKFSLDTLQDRYLWQSETSPQEAFARASVFVSTFKEETDFDMAQRIYNYVSNLWFMFSTPILSNGGTTRGLPISCFLNYVPDNREGLSSHYDENIWLASSGGGIGGYWGDVRSDGIPTSNGSKSTGSIPFMKVVDSQMLAFNQGVTRRGSYAAYMDISHPEIEEFMVMRKESGGDVNRKCLNLHNGVNITNAFLKAVEEDDDWRLIDPKTNEAVKIIKARELWSKLLDARAETGEPYIVNIDNCNDALPQGQKDLGLEVKQSNLCSEITLPTNEERTAVCCLSSVNLEHFDEWSKEEKFIDDLVTMLDNVLEHFIENAVNLNSLGGYNANYERFKKHIKEGKKVLQKLLIQPIVKGLLVLEQWVFILIYKIKTFPLRESSRLASTINYLSSSKELLLVHLEDLLYYGGKLLIFLILVLGIAISLLLHLMLVPVLFVGELLHPSNPSGLTSSLIKRYLEAIKLKTKTSKNSSTKK